jgi:hypothetical protein
VTRYSVHVKTWTFDWKVICVHLDHRRPKLAKRSPSGIHHFPSSRSNHRYALDMSKPPVLPATIVLDAALRPIGRRAKPSDLRRLGHDADALEQTAIANRDPGPSLSRTSAASTSRGAICYPT